MTKSQKQIAEELKQPNTYLIVGPDVHISKIIPLDGSTDWKQAHNRWERGRNTSLSVFRALRDAGVIVEDARTAGYSVYKLAA